MSLRDDLQAAITKGLWEIFPQPGETDHLALSVILLDRVWDTLGKVLGDSQERLMLQLTAARSELSAARQKISALTEIVRDLQKVEESSDA